MKILVICDEGNNRSVTVAGVLKYVNHDVLTAGIKRNNEETLAMLYAWAEMIIRTHTDQEVPEQFKPKLKTLPIGEDHYKRPYNTELFRKVKRLLDENKGWFGL
jgi:predicted protein tyrosine phosphatase